MAESPPPAAVAAPRGRRTLLLIALVAIAPVVASYSAYYFFRHEATLNTGALMPTAPAAPIEGTRADGTPFRLADLRGRWVIAQHDSGRCAAPCERMLYATRQARTIQGREQERIVRILVVSGSAGPDAELLAQHPGLIVVRAAGGRAGAALDAAASALLIDPLGNAVLHYDAAADIKGIARDLGRLLKASRIG
jgi:hypothetical protein